MTPDRVATRASGTPVLAEARSRLQAAAAALALACDGLQKAADALPGARTGLTALNGALAKIAGDLDERVTRPFDQAVLDELLHQPVAPRAGKRPDRARKEEGTKP